MGWFDHDKKLVGKISRLWARWVLWSMGIRYEIKGMDHLNREHQYIFMSSIASKYEHFGDYGKDKNEVEEFLKKTNLPLVILRPTYMLGIDNPHDRETYYIDRILDKRQIQVDGDGSSLLSFVFAEDVANLVSKIVNSTITNEAYNINNGEFITLNQLVSLFFNILRKETKIIFGDKGDSPFVNETMVFSNEKIAKHFDYKFKLIHLIVVSFQRMDSMA